MTIANGNGIENSESAIRVIHFLGQPTAVAAAAAPANIHPLEQRSPRNSWAPTRRSGRLTLDFAVEVYGRGHNQEMFHEDTRTLIVSAYGALISLAADVELDQVIVLTCGNREPMHCRIVHREEMPNGEVRVGIAFMTCSPTFWGVSFPTEHCRTQAA